MSQKLAKIGTIQITYNNFGTEPSPNSTLLIQSSGPYEPEGNRNTNVIYLQDDSDPFKFTLQYSDDRAPVQDTSEWISDLVSSVKRTGSDGKITVKIVFFGTAEQRAKELLFDMMPGDIAGKIALTLTGQMTL